MTVDEMIEWLESAKREAARSGQDISEYPVMRKPQPVEAWGSVDLDLPGEVDLKVDHGVSVVYVL